jgi:hypothetical protein
MRVKFLSLIIITIFSVTTLTACTNNLSLPPEAEKVTSTRNPAYSLLFIINSQNATARLSALEAPRILAHSFLAAYAAYSSAKDGMNKEYLAVKAGAEVGATLHIDRVRAANIRSIVDSFRTGNHSAEDKLALEIAEKVLAISKKDGHDESFGLYQPTDGTTSFNWEPTGRGTYGLEPMWGSIKPLIKESLECSLPTPDEELIKNQALKMLADFSLEKAVGQDVLWWLAGNGTPTPSGQWLGIASNALRDKGLSVEDSLLTLTAASIASSDSAIIAWKEKYRHNIARPETLWKILASDQSSIPTLPRETPPHPSYPSGHSVFGGAVTTILKDTIGQSPLRDTLPADLYAPGQRRDWVSIEKALEEASGSRINSGFHLPLDTSAGEALGGCVANKVIANYKNLLKEIN